MANVDSAFDLDRIAAVAGRAPGRLPVLLRINPDVDPDVHSHVATGMRDSKFGVLPERVDAMVDQIQSYEALELVGLHCHLGSTIERVEVFRDAARFMVRTAERLRAKGAPLHYLNLGGGLGIDHRRRGGMPTAADLVGAVIGLVPPELEFWRA